jgi:hypothetical protein
MRNVEDAVAAAERAAAATDDEADQLLAPASPLAPRAGEHFHAVAHTEGESTGLRTFTNLSWRDIPFAFHWQKSSSAHGGTPMTVQVGLVQRVERDPDDDQIIHAWGSLDLAGEDGREYGRQLVAGFARWVSIGLDEQPIETHIEWEEPSEDDAESDVPPPLAGLPIGKPKQVTIDGGRIGELTGVSVPAQADAGIEPTAELVRLLEQEVTTASARTEVDQVKLYAKYLDGRPAPAADDGVTGADVVEAITAAAHRIEIPDLPPAGWFEEPTDVDIPGAFCVTDDGRIFGILAPLHTGHRAFASSGQRVTVPNRNVDYSRFLGGEALTQTGRISGVGPVTMDCGHASRFRADHDVAPSHYENACAVVGKVRVGETAQGLPWVAGALEPGVRPDQLSRMLACRLSGDWQPHPDRPGWQELVACLLVPAPAFPMGRTGPTLTEREGVLVASSVPVRYVAHPEFLDPEDARAALVAAANAAGLTEQVRRARRVSRLLAEVPG